MNKMCENVKIFQFCIKWEWHWSAKKAVAIVQIRWMLIPRECTLEVLQRAKAIRKPQCVRMLPTVCLCRCVCVGVCVCMKMHVEATIEASVKPKLAAQYEMILIRWSYYCICTSFSVAIKSIWTQWSNHNSIKTHHSFIASLSWMRERNPNAHWKCCVDWVFVRVRACSRVWAHSHRHHHRFSLFICSGFQRFLKSFRIDLHLTDCFAFKCPALQLPAPLMRPLLVYRVVIAATTTAATELISNFQSIHIAIFVCPACYFKPLPASAVHKLKNIVPLFGMLFKSITATICTNAFF